MTPSTPTSPRLAPVRMHVPQPATQATSTSASTPGSSSSSSPADATGSSPALPVREATPSQLAIYASVRTLAETLQMPELRGDTQHFGQMMGQIVEWFASSPEHIAQQRGIPQFEEAAALLWKALASPTLKTLLTPSQIVLHATRLIDLMPADCLHPAFLNKLLVDHPSEHGRDNIGRLVAAQSCFSFMMRLLQKWPDHAGALETAASVWDELVKADPQSTLLGEAVWTVANLPEGLAGQTLLKPWIDQLIELVKSDPASRNLGLAIRAANFIGDTLTKMQLAFVIEQSVNLHLNQSRDGVFTMAPFFEQVLLSEGLINGREQLATALGYKCNLEHLWSPEFLADKTAIQKRQFFDLCKAVAAQGGAPQAQAARDRDMHRVWFLMRFMGLIDAIKERGATNRSEIATCLHDMAAVCKVIENKTLREKQANGLIDSLISIERRDIPSHVRNAELAMQLTVNRDEKLADPACALRLDRQHVLAILMGSLPPNGGSQANGTLIEAPLRKQIASLCLLARAGVAEQHWVPIPAWLQPDTDALLREAPSMQPAGTTHEAKFS